MPKSQTIVDATIGPLIRKRRKRLDMTLQQLSAAARISVGYLSQVERGHSTPTLGTLAGIATALDLDLHDFVGGSKAKEAHTRAESRPRFSIPGSPIRYEALSTGHPGSELSSYRLTVPPGFAAETTSHDGEEIIYIVDGSIEIVLDGRTIHMAVGDSLHYSGALPHSWANPGTEPTVIVWTGTLAVLTGENAPLPLQRIAANEDRPAGERPGRSGPNPSRPNQDGDLS